MKVYIICMILLINFVWEIFVIIVVIISFFKIYVFFVCVFKFRICKIYYFFFLLKVYWIGNVFICIGCWNVVGGVMKGLERK